MKIAFFHKNKDQKPRQRFDHNYLKKQHVKTWHKNHTMPMIVTAESHVIKHQNVTHEDLSNQQSITRRLITYDHKDKEQQQTLTLNELEPADLIN